MSSAKNGSSFKLTQQFQSDYCPASFTLYESQRTGMRVIVVNQKGPKVYGYFILATEIHDDSGAPHTLEHLIFMGSRNYKYKGLLDTIANRSYSSTNAWTATDHTAYTLESAGWDGFAQLLPVYLEHVLLPTLTDAACYTEVHHIDGSGKDAGVVYSEMQGRENTPGDLMDIFGRRLMYPPEDGYRYETGGLMENLRVLSADRIRAFHHEMYQPKNFCLGLIGEVDHDSMLDILEKFEAEASPHLPSIETPFKRPWVESKQTLIVEKSIVKTVEFPEEDESTGEISITLLGPSSNDELSLAAIEVLLAYLSGSSISILENTLVETEKLASMVYSQLEKRPSVAILFYLASVQTEKLQFVAKRFFEVLQDHAKAGIDMNYLQDCLHRQKRQIKLMTENSADSFSGDIVVDHLFGNRDGTDLIKLRDLSSYDILEKWDLTQWHTVFSKYIANANHVTVLGKPSKTMSKKIKETEQVRVKEQQERLGKDGMENQQKQLDKAKAENEKSIPDELKRRFTLPDPTSVHFIPTLTARSGLAKKMGRLDNEAQTVIDRDSSNLSLFIHFEHVQTNFIRLNVLVNTSSIPIELRPLLPVYIDNFFNTPTVHNGKREEFEDVVVQLERDTVGFSIEDGAALGNTEILRISLEVEPEKYDAGISWLKDLLFKSIFDHTRLESSFTKLLAEIPEEKRDGNEMLHAVSNMVHFSRKSSSRSQNTLVKSLYLRRMFSLLKKSPSSVIEKFESLRQHLTRPENIRVFVVADLKSGKLASPVSSWSDFTGESWPENATIDPVDSLTACQSEAGVNPGGLAYIIPMPTIDSSFALLISRGPNSFDHPDLPALMVLLGYLNATEGPLWNAVRGTGLAYGVSFARFVPLGQLHCRIYRSPDAYKALVATKEAILDIAEARTKIDDLALEGAISSIVTAFADKQPTLNSAATVGFSNQVILGVKKDWGAEMMRKVRAVTVEEAKDVLIRLLLPMFQVGGANVFVTCATIMEESLVGNLKSMGYNPEVHPLSFFQDDYGFKLEDSGMADGDENESDYDNEDEGDTGDDDDIEGNTDESGDDQ